MSKNSFFARAFEGGGANSVVKGPNGANYVKKQFFARIFEWGVGRIAWILARLKGFEGVDKSWKGISGDCAVKMPL